MATVKEGIWSVLPTPHNLAGLEGHSICSKEKGAARFYVESHDDALSARHLFIARATTVSNAGTGKGIGVHRLKI